MSWIDDGRRQGTHAEMVVTGGTSLTGGATPAGARLIAAAGGGGAGFSRSVMCVLSTRWSRSFGASRRRIRSATTQLVRDVATLGKTGRTSGLQILEHAILLCILGSRCGIERLSAGRQVLQAICSRLFASVGLSCECSEMVMVAI